MEQSDQYGGNLKLEILLVEDNPCDVVLFKQILRRSSVPCSFTVVTDSAQANQRLKHATPGKDADASQPDVIFLDLNLPGESGTEVLAKIKADPILAAIPVAVLTGSDDIGDREACTLLGADAYFNKAAVLEDFFKLAADVDSFLLNVSRQRPAAELFGAFAATSAA